jgi:hypothetical protein
MRRLWLSLFFCVFLSGCGSTVSVEDYKLEEYISQRLDKKLTSDKPKEHFNLCGFRRENWDSILIVKPYTDASTIKSLRVSNYPTVSNKVNNQSTNDSNCTLLFVDNGKYAGYSVINRKVLDFATLTKNDKLQFVWIYKNECDKIIVKHENNERYNIVFE